MKIKALLLVTLLSGATLAVADQITFHFLTETNTHDVKASSTGLTMGPALNTLVSDATTGANAVLLGVDTASTGPAASFTILSSPNLVIATYDHDGPNSVLITDLMGNTLLSGSMNDDGAFVAGYPGKTGAFLSPFTVDFVDPSIFATFGLPVGWLPNGAISVTFGQSKLVGTTLNAVTGGGTITFESAVPEPASMGLLGIGLVGLGWKLRRQN